MHTILSIDGGGIRGLIPARLLKWVEKRLQEKTDNNELRLADVFDFMAGTSTGGIMVSAYLKAHPDTKRPEFSTDEVEQLYIKNGAKIFDLNAFQQLKSGWGIADSKFSSAGIEDCMLKYFGNTKTSELLRPCIITAYDLHSHNSLFFGQHHALENPTKDFYVRDITRATSSAPVFFPAADVSSIDGKKEFLCIDGSLFAYSPAISAYAEMRRLNPEDHADSMFLLSLGTGEAVLDHSHETIKHWGMFEWSQVLSDLVCDSNGNNVDFNLNQVFRNSPDQYYRLNPMIKGKVPMMEASKKSIRNILTIADSYIEENQSQLEKIADILFKNFEERSSKIS